MAAVDPYKAYSEMYQKRTDAIAAQTKQAELEKQQREQQAQETLANANRGVYTTYKQQINPYGSFASQNNFSQGVSDYYKNASYGTMLQGIGSNQYNYNDAMNNSNSLWQNYLAQKAGDEADALNDYNAAVIAQQKYDKEQEDAERERQEAIRQYNLNLQLQQEKLAEDKRRYDQEWAYQLEQDAKAAQAAASSGGGGGSSYRTGSSPAGIPLDNGGAKTVVGTSTRASGVPGKVYEVEVYSDGTTKALRLVDDPNAKKTTTPSSSSKSSSSSSTKKTTTYKASGVKGKVYMIVNGKNMGLVDDPSINPSKYKNYGH